MATLPHDEPPPLPGNAAFSNNKPEPPPDPPPVTGRPEGVGADVNPWTQGPAASLRSPPRAPAPSKPGVGVIDFKHHGPIAKDVAAGLGSPPTLETGEPAEIRAHYLLAERKVQTAAAIHTFFGGLLALLGILFTAMGFAETPANIGALVFAGFLFGLAAVITLIGQGLRLYRPAARIAALIGAVPFFFAFPIGTVLSGFTWWAMLNRGGQVVFTEDHRRIRETTPHNGSMPGSLAWILTFVLLSLFGLLVVLASLALLTVD
ncbi:MAG: hypothetical protein EA398_03095 [Deltaproteobacteria bacterium]|nr:MAG: hypothetical protein EA398_03095 [Deltaproteobacteria bacterium]